MKAISAMWLRARHKATDMLADCRGIAATEFAVIVPIMLVLFFGTVEFSSGVAVNRKVTLIARALSDLTAQTPPPSLNSTSATMTDTYLQNVFTASIAIMAPYAPSPVKATAFGDLCRLHRHDGEGLNGASLRSSAAMPPRRPR